jgi:hypothetical protein
MGVFLHSYGGQAFVHFIFRMQAHKEASVCVHAYTLARSALAKIFQQKYWQGIFCHKIFPLTLQLKSYTMTEKKFCSKRKLN